MVAISFRVAVSSWSADVLVNSKMADSMAFMKTPGLQISLDGLQHSHSSDLFHGAVSPMNSVSEDETEFFQYIEAQVFVLKHNLSKVGTLDGQERSWPVAHGGGHEVMGIIKERGPASQGPPLSQHSDPHASLASTQVR